MTQVSEAFPYDEDAVVITMAMLMMTRIPVKSI